jgi:hypothetical protein
MTARPPQALIATRQRDSTRRRQRVLDALDQLAATGHALRNQRVGRRPRRRRRPVLPLPSPRPARQDPRTGRRSRHQPGIDRPQQAIPARRPGQPPSAEPAAAPAEPQPHRPPLWTQSRGLSERERRIIYEPVQLPKDEPSADALRIRMAEAQALVAENPGTAKAGGTKRIRLQLSIPGYRVNADDAERLERTLAEPVQEAAAQELTYSPVEMAEAAIEDAAGNLTRLSRGQGFQLDQEIKDAVEAFAMNTATKFYREAGWQVEDVHGSESYDLICSKDETSTHVEVKGTTGDGTNPHLQ